MDKKVFIRGKSLICSLGEEIDDIISAVEKQQITVDQVLLTLTGMNYTRPYYRIHRKNSEIIVEQEKYFYDILFDSISAAIEDAGLKDSELSDMALFFGSTSIDIPIYENLYRNNESSETSILSHTSLGYGKIISKVGEKFGINGPCYTFTTACTSSANGIIYASSMIKKGRIKRAMVIGYDLYIDLGFYGFESLKLISPL